MPFECANLMDALQAERDQNITIDTAQIWFRTAKREYVIIDAPGHKEFVKNMVTGAARAEAALLLIDAPEGVQEQTRRHGYLLQLIGVRQVVVVVNKMDLVDYSQEVFDKVSSEYRQFLKSIGVEAPVHPAGLGAPGRQHRGARREPDVVQRPDGARSARRDSRSPRRSRTSRFASPSRTSIASTIAAFSRAASRPARCASATSCCFCPRAARASCARSSAGTRRRSNR